MQIKQYESEWHGINLSDVDQCREGVADAVFYKKFYQKMDSGNISGEWIDKKLKISRWVENNYLKPLKGTRVGGFKILSLAAGTGIIEKEWLEKGYNVDLQECQEESLRPLKELYPDVNIFICDVRSLPVDNKYDLIFISALDYVFSRKDYFELLGGLSKILRDNGIVFIVCVTNITFIGITKGIIKRLLIKPKRDIHWGWKRTIGEHIAAGQRANLNVASIYSFVGGDTETVKIYKPVFPYNLIINDSYVVGIELVKRGVNL